MLVALIIGGTAGVTIMDAAQASQSSHERAEAAQVQAYERTQQEANNT